jgi:anti-sigma B factor antagonist
MAEMNETDLDEAPPTIAVSPADPPGWRVTLAGEIDLSTVPELESAMERASVPDTAEVAFDLSRVSFMDSSGLAFLIGVGRRVARIHIAAASPEVRQLVELAGLTTTLGLRP